MTGNLACPRCKRPLGERTECPFDAWPAIPAGALAPDDPMQGEVVARRYQVLHAIGHGGMGTVYSAWDLDAGAEVALKVIRWDTGRDPALIARFRREVSATQRLVHPNVVRLLDSGRTTSGYLYIAMERLVGCTLAEHIRAEAPMPGDRAARLLVPVCDALEAAHGLGLVHRDLKPANIFLARTDGPEHLVKLLDFGIARAMDHDPVDDAICGGLVVGTVSYVAPEQARREPVDGRTDLYAIGILLFELLTGRTPFTRAAPLETLRAHVMEPPPSPRSLAPAHVTPELERLCLELLAKAPDDRPATAAEVRRRLTAAVRPEVVVAPEAHPPQSRRLRRALLAVAVATIAAAILRLAC
ncbi:MAG: hypothetical protein AMXMBFR64_50640 [Myxococcales bacterium]